MFCVVKITLAIQVTLGGGFVWEKKKNGSFSV